MYQSYRQGFIQKSAKIQRRKKECEQLRKDISKMMPLNLQKTIGRLLRMHYGRKNQLVEQKSVLTPFIPTASQDYRPYGYIKYKDSTPGFNKRHTHYISELNQILKHTTMPEKSEPVGLPRKRIKLSINIGPNANQKISQHKSGEKLHRKKKKVVDQTEQYSKTTKKLGRISESTSIFGPDSSQVSFIDLIKKFKFQNLKTLPRAPTVVPHGSIKRTELQPKSKSPNYFASLTHYGAWKNHKNMKQANKTMMPSQWKQCRDETQVNRKISMLSPWQLVVEGGMTGQTDFSGNY